MDTINKDTATQPDNKLLIQQIDEILAGMNHDQLQAVYQQLTPTSVDEEEESFPLFLASMELLAEDVGSAEDDAAFAYLQNIEGWEPTPEEDEEYARLLEEERRSRS